MKQPEPEFQLQVFDGHEYRTVAAGERRAIGAAFIECRERVRRMVRTDRNRPARPQYRAPSGPRGAKTRDETISAYLAWAQSKGLKRVSFYAGDFRSSLARERFDVVEVDPAEFIGDAPAEETDDE
jgi:hypothetical protein